MNSVALFFSFLFFFFSRTTVMAEAKECAAFMKIMKNCFLLHEDDGNKTITQKKYFRKK